MPSSGTPHRTAPTARRGRAFRATSGAGVTHHAGDGGRKPLRHGGHRFAPRTRLSFRGQHGGVDGIALNAVGFQGLGHDEGLDAIDNRARVYLPPLGRFAQTDPLGYPDGLNPYAAYHVMWGGVDPMGLDYVTTTSSGTVIYVPETWYGRDQQSQTIGRINDGGTVTLNGATGTGLRGTTIGFQELKDMGDTSDWSSFTSSMSDWHREEHLNLRAMEDPFGRPSGYFGNLARGANEAFGDSEYARCIRRCFADEHKSLVNQAIFGGSFLGYEAMAAGVPRSWAELIAGDKVPQLGTSLKSGFRAVGHRLMRMGVPDSLNAFRAEGVAFDKGHGSVRGWFGKGKPVLRGNSVGMKAARGGVAALAVLEAYIGIKCGQKCKDCDEDSH